MSKTIVVITGGFDPLHSGHLDYIESARKLGDILVVGVNSDEWLTRKKGRPFMPLQERIKLINALKNVDKVITFDDSDNSAKNAIVKTRLHWPDDNIIFANGGDRTETNIPEMDLVDDKLSFVFGVGGTDKANSSSWILQEWKAPKTNRDWGYYRVLHECGIKTKVKELIVEPGKSLSMQKHFRRAEWWFVSEGVASLYTLDYNNEVIKEGTYVQFKTIHIPTGRWHQLVNETTKPLKIIEIQYGNECIEEDIERK